jgi:hypothetical protein
VAPLPNLGKLAEVEFPELVHQLQERRFSGVLRLTRSGVIKRVTVEEGRMVFASSSDPDDRLGELLLRRGRISLRQLIDAAAALGQGKRMGTILIEHGLLSPRELVQAVTEQTQDIIYDLFRWTDGSYALDEGLRPAEAITLNIPPGKLIFEGIRRIESWVRIDRAVGGLDACYRRRPGGEDTPGRLDLDDDHAALLTALDSPCSVEELCRLMTISSFEVCRSLWAFRVIGLVQRVEPGEGEIDDEGLGDVLGEE